MSLVERALSRLGRVSGTKPTTESFVQLIATPNLHEGSRAKRLVVDINGLRAGGYLPEPDKDRQFVDHYRQIKRPLIRKALAVNDVVAANDRRLIMVTSVLPGDGKTFTSINLALSVARERDISVLLVDTDLLKPHVTKIFGLHQELGLMDALVDETVSVESLVVPTSIPGFSILPAGTPMEGTSELLSSNRMQQILKGLYIANPRRIILLDSPPVLITSEAKVLVSLAGQIVLVVRAGRTPPLAIQDAVALFGEDQAGGVVLNDAKSGMDRYHGYGKYGTYGNENGPGR